MSSEIPQPRPSRWRRWTTVALLVAGATLAWLFLTEAPEVQQARAVTLGMTQAEVAAILGSGGDMIDYGGLQPGLVRGASYTRWFRFYTRLEQMAGRSHLSSSFDDWPVHVRFDKSGRVSRIKRGSEIVEAPSK
jgi:hypothetical protein